MARRPISPLVITLIAIIATYLPTPARAGVILQGFYMNAPSGYGNPWWWDHIAEQAHTFAADGFSAVWIPPSIKGASGGYSSGYDPFDDYDLGDKNQKGTMPTHYGNREQLERCCGMLRANGIDIYQDLVENHRDGDDGNFNFAYVDAYGNVTGGRFGKGFYDLHPNVPQDPDVPDGSGEFSFGRDFAPVNGAKTSINGTQQVWVDYNLKQAGDWLTKALDLQGYRLDYVRGISWDWLGSFLSYGAMSGKFAVGENWTDNVGDLDNWAKNDMAGLSHAFDFPLHDGYLVPMCNNPGSFDMSTLDHAGLAGTDPSLAVTFVENHDTDSSNPITQNKLMAYAYILTSEGYPCVFYKDWSKDSGCYGAGMQDAIDNLIWIHEKLASGSTQQRWKNNQIFAYERQGAQHLLVGLNSDTGNSHQITCATGFGSGVTLHDFTGHSGDVTTDGSGNATITIPVNNSGTGYVAYAPAGSYGSITPPTYATTQEYSGSQDLDIKPADNTQQVTVSRVYAASGQNISGALYYDTAGWTSSTNIALEVDKPNGTVLSTGTYTNATAQGATVTGAASMPGFYTWKIRSNNTPSTNAKPNYWLRVTFTAPSTFPSGPTLTSVSPNIIQVGAASSTITVTGTAFDPTSTVDWNGNALATTYVSSTSLTAVVPSTDLTTSSTAAVTVVTAAPGGGTSATKNITVTPFLSGIGLSPTTVVGGAVSTGVVSITSPAPNGGTVVSLASGYSACASVPSTVTVPAGAKTANFAIKTNPCPTQMSILITARLGVSRTVKITVNPTIMKSVTVAPSAVTGGTNSTGTVTLTAPAASDTTVNLKSGYSAVVYVPASVVVHAGSSFANFTVKTHAVSSSIAVSITASVDVPKSTKITVNP